MADTKKLYGTVLIKASNILDTLAGTPDALAVKEISELSDLTMPTTSKILNTLEHIGYVKRDEERKYSLGGKLIHLAAASFMQFDIVREAHPALKHLYSQFNETVHLGMLQGDQVLYINKMSPKEENKGMLSRIGHTQELYSSAMGKAILANLGPVKQNDYFESKEFKPNTPHTITEKDALYEQLMEIRDRGYAIDDREAEDNVYCVGSAIELSDESRDCYAFSVSIPYEKITETMKEEVIAEVKKAKNIIEFQLESAGV